MLNRCENPDSANYPGYGGRGIAVCDRWHDLRLFIQDIEQALGPRPQGRSLDRWPDNDGNYEPGNVRWATGSEQWHNSRLGLLRKLVIWDGSVQQGSEAERWLPVRRHAGWYEASTGGEVVSLPRATTRGGPLAYRITAQGYRQVRLSKYGRVTTLLVGQIVLETFVGPRPPGKRVRHGPGGKLDDSLGNLWWG